LPWDRFEKFLEARGDASSPRIAYYRGTLELMSPSKDHERIKGYIGRLVEVYAEERDIEMSPYGSWTLKRKPRESAKEPDECYIFGPDQDKPIPDLAIEVEWTSSGLATMEIYAALGIREVWIWRDDSIQVHVLRGGAYKHVRRSVVLPGLDLDLLVSCLRRSSATRAKRDYRRALSRPVRSPGKRAR
jgi:Uma2 family endonuclease